MGVVSNYVESNWVKNAVNSQGIIWFMQGICYEWLNINSFTNECSNLHSIKNKNIFSLLYKFFQTCCESGPYFMSVLKIVGRQPGSHDKVIYMNFFYNVYKSNQVRKLQYMVIPEIQSLVLIFCFVCNPYPFAWQSWWQFWCLLFEPRKSKRLSRHRLLVKKFDICEIHRYVMQPENRDL